jgi:cell division protein FtsW (lipid II flippase)
MDDMRAALERFRFTEFQLLIVPSLMAIVGLLTIFLARTGEATWTWADIWVSLAYVVLLVGITLWFSATGFRGDQVLFPIVAMLAGMGLLMIQRLEPMLAQTGGALATVAQRQVVYLALGLLLLWGMMIFVKRLNWLRRYKYTLAFAGVMLMVITMVFGQEISGARLWLNLGVVMVQPGELVKVILVVFLAAYLADHHDLLAGHYRLGPLRLPPIPYLIPLVFMWLMSVLIVVLQNDLGTALLFFGIFLTMLYVSTGRLLYVVSGLTSFVIAVYLTYEMFGHVAIRVRNWIDPWASPLGIGYQQIQGEYALATGGFFGTGLGYGHPGFIPVVETDYIFAAIGEELGLIGTFGVLCLYMLLIARGYLIAVRAVSQFERLLATGVTTILALQTLIIVAGNLRLIPLTGITLPFISAGGSALLANFLVIGILLRISESKWDRR